MDDFNTLVVEHDYNPFKRMLKTGSIQDSSISNEQLLHNVLFECFDQSVENQSKAWENPQNVCSKSQIERPFYQKNMQKLPDPVPNDVLSFIDSKYWLPSDVRSREDRKVELKNKNVSITGWNYNERDISDLINCFNTIKKIKKENLLLFINFENVLEYTLKLSHVINQKKCLTDDEKDKLKFNSTLRDLTSMNHTVKKMVEQLEHLKEKNEVAVMTQSELVIKKMADEINFFRKKYKKNEDYVFERDHLHFENLDAFLFSDPVHKYQIGMQNVDNYYYPDTQPNTFQFKNVLHVKKMDDNYNVMINLNEFIRKNLTTKKDDPEKSKDDIIKDICSEYSDIFQAVIEHSHLKSKLEYLSYYRDSFLHINAITTIHNLSKKNIREICESKLDMKNLEAEIAVNFEKVNREINQYSALFETMDLKYPVGYVADLLLSSFFKGLNYERSFNAKFKDLSPESVVLKTLKQLTREKNLPLYIFHDGYKQTIMNARLDSILLNKQSTVQYNSVFFGFNSTAKNKDNILNEVFNSQLKSVTSQFLQSSAPTYEACFEFLKQKIPTCDFSNIYKSTKKIMEKVEKECLNERNMLIFYYITFFILDTLCNCTDRYVSAFHGSSLTWKHLRKQALEYLTTLNAIQLYDSFQADSDEQRTQVLRVLIGFSVQLYNLLFNFDDQYFFVCMNSFFKCFIPLLLSESNSIDETKLVNYECFFETALEFKKPSNLSIESQWCLKGIKIDDCPGEEDTVMDEFEIVNKTEQQHTRLSQLNKLIVDVSGFLETGSSDEMNQLLQEITEFRDFNSIFLYLGLYDEMDDKQLTDKIKEFSERFEELKTTSKDKITKPEEDDIFTKLYNLNNRLYFRRWKNHKIPDEVFELQKEINLLISQIESDQSKNKPIDETQLQQKIDEYTIKVENALKLAPNIHLNYGFLFDDEDTDDQQEKTDEKDDVFTNLYKLEQRLYFRRWRNHRIPDEVIQLQKEINLLIHQIESDQAENKSIDETQLQQKIDEYTIKVENALKLAPNTHSIFGYYDDEESNDQQEEANEPQEEANEPQEEANEPQEEDTEESESNEALSQPMDEPLKTLPQGKELNQLTGEELLAEAAARTGTSLSKLHNDTIQSAPDGARFIKRWTRQDVIDWIQADLEGAEKERFVDYLMRMKAEYKSKYGTAESAPSQGDASAEISVQTKPALLPEPHSKALQTPETYESIQVKTQPPEFPVQLDNLSTTSQRPKKISRRRILNRPVNAENENDDDYESIGSKKSRRNDQENNTQKKMIIPLTMNWT